jgi:hypothetical protein
MTKADKPRLGAGDVTIVLGDDEYTLKPSLKAARRICQRYQSLVNAATQAAMADIECILVIVGAGLNLTPRGLAEMEEKIFAAGLSDDTGGLAKRCAEFCGVLMGGGRLPSEASDTAEASQDSPDPQNSRRATRGSSTG